MCVTHPSATTAPREAVATGRLGGTTAYAQALLVGKAAGQPASSLQLRGVPRQHPCAPSGPATGRTAQPRSTLQALAGHPHELQCPPHKAWTVPCPSGGRGPRRYLGSVRGGSPAGTQPGAGHAQAQPSEGWRCEGSRLQACPDLAGASSFTSTLPTSFPALGKGWWSPAGPGGRKWPGSTSALSEQGPDTALWTELRSCWLPHTSPKGTVLLQCGLGMPPFARNTQGVEGCGEA